MREEPGLRVRRGLVLTAPLAGRSWSLPGSHARQPSTRSRSAAGLVPGAQLLQRFTSVADLAPNPAGGLFVAHDPTNGALISRLP